MSERDFPYGKPIRVDGGLRARSARGAIGESWWSKRFLATLESFAMGGRLTRGRSYARAGQVLQLDIAAGAVTAQVQGSRPDPYAVRIELAVFPDAVWDRVERALTEQAIYSARLLAGEMPADIEDVFTAAGAPLFPTSPAELGLHCSCPDWGVPCKHLAATFYLLAEAFDVDPFQIMRWRGRDRAALLGHLRATAEIREDRQPAVGAGPVLADVPAPSLTADRFWLPPVPLPASRPPTLDTDADLLLRQLPEPGPALGGADLVNRLRAAYASFGAAPESGSVSGPDDNSVI